MKNIISYKINFIALVLFFSSSYSLAQAVPLLLRDATPEELAQIRREQAERERQKDPFAISPVVEGISEFLSISDLDNFVQTAKFVHQTAQPIKQKKFILNLLDRIEQNSCSPSKLLKLSEIKITDLDILNRLKNLLVHSTNAYIRILAADRLGESEVSDLKIVSELVKAAKDPNDSVRSAAINALGRSKALHPLKHETIFNALEDPSLEVHMAALSVLWSSEPSEKKLLILSEASKDPNPKIRETAIRALGKAKVYRPEIFQIFTSALRDQDSRVSETALWALGVWANEEECELFDLLSFDDVSTLLNALSRNTETSVSAARVLGKYRPSDSDFKIQNALIEVIKNNEENTVQLVIEAFKALTKLNASKPHFEISEFLNETVRMLREAREELVKANSSAAVVRNMLALFAEAIREYENIE